MVSVIIPNYNHSAFLKERIQSVLNQTYSDFELIILDDCSSDKSRDIIESFRSNPKVSHIIYNDRNSGSTFRQWNKGLQLAKGDWIWIAESDDMAHKDFLSTLIAKAQKDDGLVYCCSMDIDEKGKEVGIHDWAWKLDVNRWKTDYENNGLNEIKRYLIYRTTITNTSSVIFRNCFEIPDQVLEMRFCGDWYFWIHILKNTKIRYVSTPLNYLRIHNTITRVRKDKYSEAIRFKEWKITIDYAMQIIDDKYRVVLNFRKYDWIIDDILHKIRKFGRLSNISINPPLPAFLRPYYYYRLFKMFITGQVK